MLNSTTWNSTIASTTSDSCSLHEKTCADKAESYLLSVPFYYTGIFSGIIFCCSFVYFFKLKRHKNIYVKAGIYSNVKEYFKILYKFRSMHGSVFTQLFDQVSDISVINQLYLLSSDLNSENADFDCCHMNVTYLFYASVFVFVFYRFLSSIMVYRAINRNVNFQRKLLLFILQFFDLSFILTLRINYKFQNVTPCNPQRYITNLEAIYESCPQLLIQSYFLITLNMSQNKSATISGIDGQLFVIVSIAMSLWSILSRKLSHDKDLVVNDWQSLIPTAWRRFVCVLQNIVTFLFSIFYFLRILSIFYF